MVGSGHAKLAGTLYTVLRIHYTERVVPLLKWLRMGVWGSACLALCRRAVVPDPFVCFARPSLPGGALGSSPQNPPSLKNPGLWVRASGVALGSVYFNEGASQCERAYGGCVPLH